MLTFVVGDKVLNNDISHIVPIRIAVFEETMHCAEKKLVVRDRPVLATQRLSKPTIQDKFQKSKLMRKNKVG